MLKAIISNISNQNESVRIKILLQVTCLFWLVAKLITWKLWLSNRLYPITPVFDIFYKVHEGFHILLLLVSIICLIFLFLRPKTNHLLVVLLIVEILSCALDQNRWQPWEYQYIFTIFIFLIYKKKQENIIVTIAFILACTYFFSGLSKINSGFLDKVWSNMILMKFFKVSKMIANHHIIRHIGYLFGIAEAALGLALFVGKPRKIVAVVLILMHLFILFLLGPFGLKYNSSIWPWNMSMIFYLITIFFSSYKLDFLKLVQVESIPVVIFWGLLPALNFIGKWDDYLGSAEKL